MSINPSFRRQLAPLDTELLRTICSHPGPAITLMIPSLHPGAASESTPSIIRGLLRHADETLDALNIPVDGLLGPMTELVESLVTERGGDALVVFRTPDHLSAYRTAALLEPHIVLAEHLCVSPLVTEAVVSRECFVLALNQKQLHLYRYNDRRCYEQPWPDAVPRCPRDAFASEAPDHDLENRSSAGSSIGDMKAVRFGTAAHREEEPDYLHRYFALVAREIKPFLQGRPVILTGVKQTIEMFQGVNADFPLLPLVIEGNTDHWDLASLADRVHRARLQEYQLEGESTISQYLEMSDRSRACSGVLNVLSMASQGRVHRLVAPSDQTLIASLIPEIPGRLGDEDLCNACVAETLAHRGEVFLLPADRIPTADSICAILRY